MPITPLPTPPSRQDPANFASRADAFLGALPTFATEANALQADVNAKQTAAANSATAAANSATAAHNSQLAAAGASNYRGEWSTLSGALNVPASVSHNGSLWLLRVNLANVSTSQPGVSGDWLQIHKPLPTGNVVGTTDSQTLTNKILTSPVINTPTINTPTISTATINTATINTATINTPTINTPTINTPTISTATINTATINTATINTPVINTPVITENVQVVSTNTTAVRSRTYVLTQSITLTLPATPSAGDWVRVINRSGTRTVTISRNSSNIMGLAENLILDYENASVTLIYTDSTIGWVIN